MRKLLVCVADHPTLTLSLCVLAAFLLLNVLAYRHAWSMTHFISVSGPLRNNGRSHSALPARSLLDRLQLAFRGVAIPRPGEDARPDSLKLTYEHHEYAGGMGQLAAWHISRARARGTVVLFHGYSASKSHLLAEARIFHDLGYACFLVDFRGNGGSEGNGTSIGYHEAEDVERSVAYVRTCWPNEPLILFGHSMGAAAVLRAVCHHGVEANAVVLESPFDRLLSTVQARFVERGLPTFPAARLLVFWGSVQLGYNGFAHNPVDYARQVKCPALLLHGTSDPHVSQAAVEAIHRNLTGEKELHFFEGIGHGSIAALRPEEWTERVGGFLSRHVPCGART